MLKIQYTNYPVPVKVNSNLYKFDIPLNQRIYADDNIETIQLENSIRYNDGVPYGTANPSYESIKIANRLMIKKMPYDDEIIYFMKKSDALYTDYRLLFDRDFTMEILRATVPANSYRWLRPQFINSSGTPLEFPDFRLSRIQSQWINLGDPSDDSEFKFFYNVIGQVAIVSAGDTIKVQPTFVLYNYSSLLNKWVEMDVEYLKIRYVTNAASTPEGFVLSDGTSEENGPWNPSNPNSGHEGMVQESDFPPFWNTLLNPIEGVDFNEYWKTHAVRIILTQIP